MRTRSTHTSIHILARSLALTALFASAGFASAQGAADTAKCEVPTWETKVKAAPGNLSLVVELGKAYLCAGRFRDAQYTLEDAVALDFKSFDAHFFLARSLFDQGDPDAALFEYNQLAGLYVERMEPHYQMGVVYSRLRKSDDAIKSFTTAIELGKKAQAPANVMIDAYTGLISQQRAKGDTAGAAKSYEDALAIKPGDSSLALGRAQMLFESGKASDALPQAYELVRQNAGNSAAVLLIADIYEKQGLSDRAIREIDRALEVVKSGKERSNLLTRRGLLLQKLGRKADAISAFTAAANTYPEAWEAQYNLGVLKLNSAPSEALAHFRSAAKLRPEDGDIQLNIAAAQMLLKNYSAGYTAAKTAMQLLANPVNKAKARLLAGQAAYLSGQFRDAESELKPLATGEPASYQNQLWYGLTLLALKDSANAIVAFENASKLDASATEARTNLGAAYISAKRYADAERVSREVVAVEPKNADALANLGIALANLGKRDEARETLRKAAALGSVAAKRALEALK
jgi:tetratricopeptide (TPR) repeat protein